MNAIAQRVIELSTDHEARLDGYRRRIIERTAEALAAAGHQRIALFGAGRHTKPIVRQPWLTHGIAVTSIIDDAPPPTGMLGGIPVVTPEQAIAKAGHGFAADLSGDRAEASGERFSAIVISSEAYEDALHARATESMGAAGIPIIRLYEREDAYSEHRTTDRLRRLARTQSGPSALREDDIAWLVANRDERHDATLPMVRPDRAEFHLRRYELAAWIASQSTGTTSAPIDHAADLASGTGYGTAMLASTGIGHVIGVDINERAVAYASRRHSAGGACVFRCASVTDTGIESGSCGLVASFETIEHVEDTEGLVNELARVLEPGGSLVISTPNKLGPTPYHVHDFGFREFRAALERRFSIRAWFGQRPVDDVYETDLPPGIWRLDTDAAAADQTDALGRRADVLIAVAIPKPREGEIDANAGGDVVAIPTRHGEIRMIAANPLTAWRAETLLTKEPETIEWLDRFEPGDVFWDVGANIGSYTLYAARSGVASRILAFEPSPWNLGLLADHIRLNGVSAGVGAYGIALSDATELGTLFMSKPGVGTAQSSFAEPVGESGERFEPALALGSVGIRIDDMVNIFGAPQPTRLKIDVDGAEERVLAGAGMTLSDARLRSVSIELDASRQDLVERVEGVLDAAGLKLAAKRHASDFACGANASIYNFWFDRV
ncbi:MAG: FkbM family methyltransferase [Planctomycetota bacterium]